MFKLKASEISGYPYGVIESSDSLCELKKIAHKKYDGGFQRWVIVNENDELIAYSYLIEQLINELVAVYKKDKSKSVSEDIYVQRLLKENNIPYITVDDIIKDIAHNPKYKLPKSKFVFGKNSR